MRNLLPAAGIVPIRKEPRTTEQFWEIIAASRSKWNSKQPEASRKRQIEHLARLLFALPPDEIAAFERRYGALHSAAYHWDLWAAAYLTKNNKQGILC